jgi:hypothetical protein
LQNRCRFKFVELWFVVTKIATRMICKDGVWGLNTLDCDGVVSGWSCVGDKGKRKGAGIGSR